jgi:hypothetical protein
MTKAVETIIGHKIDSGKVLWQLALPRHESVGQLEEGELKYWHLTLQERPYWPV